jgi:pilus assembly protein FimV
MTIVSTRLRARIGALAALALVHRLAVAQPVEIPDNPAAREALARLLAGAAAATPAGQPAAALTPGARWPSPSPAARAPYPGGRMAGAQAAGGFHVVQRGETLDAIISRTMRGVPLDRAQLRAAIVRANPLAFVGGNPHRLIAGASLWFPSADAGAAGAPPRLQRKPDEDRRNWVRYP